MNQPRAIEDSALVSYGLLAGGVRVFVPPVFDLPFVRAVRGAMFDRLARAAEVTLTAEARRTLVDLEQSSTGRGAAEQALRWVAGRLIPWGPALDTVRNILRTYAAGVLFRRYLDVHRREPKDPVMTAIEAGRVRNALRASIEIASLDHLRAMARIAAESVKGVENSNGLSVVQRYSDVVVSTVAELPMTWVDVLDHEFARLVNATYPPL